MNQHGINNGAVASDPHANVKSSAEYLNYIQQQKKDKTKANGLTEFIFADEKMLRVREIIHQIANTNVPVLISGESGTGKEIVARMIHACSNRKSNPFAAVNCGSVPDNLLEAELFGYEPGAFNGSATAQMGKIEQASNGTLLLDEISELDQNLQAKLLRTLQDGSIERLGATSPTKIDTRIIATTNKDLSQLVSEDKFRQDLFYRLYVINLEIPPLRDRKKDIEVLTRHFLKSFSMQFKGQPATISADAMQKLLRYPWPGNVRELQNVLQRAVLMSNGSTITADEFVLEGKKVNDSLDWVKHLPIGRKMREVEIHFIIETLKNHNGNRTHSAKTLGISLRTLRNKINEFVIEGYEIPQPMSGKAL